MAKVVMLTALAGQEFSVQAGEAYETSDGEASSLVANQYAREFDAKADAHLPVVRCVVPSDPPVAATPAPAPAATDDDDDDQEADAQPKQSRPATTRRRR
jgi:hypothetical protein